MLDLHVIPPLQERGRERESSERNNEERGPDHSVEEEALGYRQLPIHAPGSRAFICVAIYHDLAISSRERCHGVLNPSGSTVA